MLLHFTIVKYSQNFKTHLNNSQRPDFFSTRYKTSFDDGYFVTKINLTKTGPQIFEMFQQNHNKIPNFVNASLNLALQIKFLIGVLSES